MKGKKIFPSGFTLVELLVVVSILTVLVSFILVQLNPITQINKAKDAQRKHDLLQIRNALDAYYNDTGCYPTQASNNPPFGSEWSNGNTIYIKKVPQDPDCTINGYCYVYQTDSTNNCPQWNILYAHLSIKLTTTQLKLSCSTYYGCINQGGVGGIISPKYNYCVVSGNIDCDYVRSNRINPPATPTPTSFVPTPTPTPTVVQGQCTCANAQYGIPVDTCQDVGVGSIYAKYCDIQCTQLCQ